MSPYPEIQYLALDIVADVIGRNKDEDIRALFYETNGVKVLLDFLKVKTILYEIIIFFVNKVS